MAIDAAMQDSEDTRRQGQESHIFHIDHLSVAKETFMLFTLTCTQVFALGCLAQAIFPDAVIRRSFGVDEYRGNWGPAGYGLTSGAFMLPAGRIGDLYGHRRCYLAAWGWLAVSSLLAGISVYSRSFIFFAVCRGLQGMATAMLLPCALAILGSVYKEGPRKNLAFSIFAAGSPTGFTVGGVFSGLLARLSWWPWIFWVTTFACCGLLVIAYYAIPELPGGLDRKKHIQLRQQQAEDTQQSLPEKRSNYDGFDWLGAITGVSGLIMFNVAWNQAPAIGWHAASNIALVLIGSVMIVIFLFVEKHGRQPLLPIDSLSADSAFVLAIMALAWSSFGVLTFYLVGFITQIRGDTMLSAAAQFAPVPIAGFAASYLNSLLLGHSFRPVDILAFSTVWFIIGNVLLATLPVRQLFWRQVFWINVLAPTGIDLSFPSATLLISQLVPRERQGVAASLIATVVYYSQSIGLGIAGTVQAYTAHDDVLKGHRSAAYTGIGLSSFSFFIALWPVIHSRIKKEKPIL